jgi:hypothetical protein
MQINLMLAIDFTGSNGVATDPSSLHYLSSRRQNDYQATIEKVGSILAPFDSDGQIPAFGFGARFPNGQTSHCFNLNGLSSPECNGMPEVLHHYQSAVQNLQLYGPTNFSEFLTMSETVARSAAVTQENQEYYVLLVITDGVITDMQDTISTIVRASSEPLSIVIVGVGNADFDAMDVLDADDEPLRCPRTRRLMQRDIVQFVPYRDFRNAGTAALAEEVLREIPEQVIGFMRSKGIVPGGGWQPTASASAPSAGLAASADVDGGALVRTASGRLVQEQARRVAVADELYETETELSTADRELRRVRAQIASVGGNPVTHQGWLAIEKDAEWERRWCKIIISEEGATLHIAQQSATNDPSAASIEIPLAGPLGRVVARPWPKSRRAVAPFAFRYATAMCTSGCQ